MFNTFIYVPAMKVKGEGKFCDTTNLTKSQLHLTGTVLVHFKNPG